VRFARGGKIESLESPTSIASLALWALGAPRQTAEEAPAAPPEERVGFLPVASPGSIAAPS
jgi:hypothetical protein